MSAALHRHRDAPGAAYRGVSWAAQVRALLAAAARAEPARPALVDALGTVSAGRLFADAVRTARSLSGHTAASGGYRIITGPSDRRFVTEMLGTLLAGRVPVLAPAHAAAQVPALLAEAAGPCRAWRVTLDALGGQLAAFSTCGGPDLGDADLPAALGMQPGGRALIARPLYAPLAIETALRQILSGGTAILASPFDPERWLRLCAALRPDWALCTPTQLGRLLAAPGPSLAAAAAGVRILMIDGQCPAALRAAALRALPADRFLQYHGTPLYHGAAAAGAMLAAGEPEHTVLPGAALRVLDQHACVQPPGRPGTIQGRAHSHPLAACCPRPGAWAHWGERGALTASGRLIVTDEHIEGRAVIDGVGVALGRIRSTLARHPAVSAVELTVGLDQFGGQWLSARIRSANPALDHSTLSAWVSAHLDPAERPSDLSLIRAEREDDP